MRHQRRLKKLTMLQFEAKIYHFLVANLYKIRFRLLFCAIKNVVPKNATNNYAVIALNVSSSSC